MVQRCYNVQKWCYIIYFFVSNSAYARTTLIHAHGTYIPTDFANLPNNKFLYSNTSNDSNYFSRVGGHKLIYNYLPTEILIGGLLKNSLFALGMRSIGAVPGWTPKLVCTWRLAIHVPTYLTLYEHINHDINKVRVILCGCVIIYRTIWDWLIRNLLSLC